jgi:hypothetical protein
MVEMTEVRILKIDPDDLDGKKTQQVVNKPNKIMELQSLLNSGYNIVACVTDDYYLYYTLIMKYDFDFD